MEHDTVVEEVIVRALQGRFTYTSEWIDEKAVVVTFPDAATCNKALKRMELVFALTATKRTSETSFIIRKK